MSPRSIYYDIYIITVIGTLLYFAECNDLALRSMDSTMNPEIVMKNCTIGELCSDAINATEVHYYSVQLWFNPSRAIRLATNMKYDTKEVAPILIVVRQVLGVVSWSLPYVLSNGMIYSNVTRILCLQNEINRTHPHMTKIFIEISTSNQNLINYSLQLDNTTEYSLETNVERAFTVSPSMPVYYKFTFPASVDSIFIEVKSNDKLCAIVSVQSFDCPVYDVGEIGFRQGHYQTMSTSASFNVYANEFIKRNDFLLVFLVQPTDADCLNYKETANVDPSGYVDVHRMKNATVILTTSNYSYYLYLTIFLTLGLFFSVYVCAILIMCRNPDVYDNITPADLKLLETGIERERTESHDSIQRRRPIENEERIVEERRDQFQSQVSIVEVIATSRRGFVTVSNLSVKDYASVKQNFRMYPRTMLTIAIFYSLPVIQLVLQYQLNIDSIGNEDLCYFNFLCTREFLKLTAFNNVFSNIGYCSLGALLFVLVYRRNKAYDRFLVQQPIIAKEYGIPQYFGLLYAMAIGLFMEGIMSACYHVCPSRQNFQFDTSFMFIMAVLSIIKIYQTRHPDVNPRSASVFSFLAAMIFINVIGVYYDNQVFWIIYAVVHIITFITYTGKIYYMGRLKFSFRIHIHLYRLMNENGLFSRPRYLNRIPILIVANAVNFAFALYGAIVQPESFPNHLLFVFLGNLALYLTYYILMKLIHRERFTISAIACLVLSLAFWGASLIFFYNEVKNYEVQPANSRTFNKPCLLLHTYDAHDVWHLLSSFGLFFSFLLIIIIDDGVRRRLRKELASF